MKLEIVVRSEARNEILEAAKWYGNNLKGLGDRFLTSIDFAVTSIQKDPLAFPKVHKEIRRTLLKKFPFGLFYLFDDNRIVIIAVFHSSRNPMGWQRRIK